MGLPEIHPEWLSAELLLGHPSIDRIPPSSRLVDPGKCLTAPIWHPPSQPHSTCAGWSL
jgi:hypothetical protein